MGFEVNEPETQESSVKTLDMEEDLESRMDQDVREKWSTNFSTSTAPHFGPKDESLVKSELVLSILFPHKISPMHCYAPVGS